MELRIINRIENDSSNNMTANYLTVTGSCESETRNDEVIARNPSVTSLYRQGSRVLSFEQILVNLKHQKLLRETFGFMKSLAHRNRVITRKVFDGLKRWMIASKYLRAHEAIKQKQAESYVPRVATIHTASSYAKVAEQTGDPSTGTATKRPSSVKRISRSHIDSDNQSDTSSIYKHRSRERSGSLTSLRSQQQYSATANTALELGGFPTAAVRTLASHRLYSQINTAEAAADCSSTSSVLGLPLVKASLHLPIAHSSSMPAATALSPTSMRSPGSVILTSSHIPYSTPYSTSSRARESPLRSLLRPAGVPSSTTPPLSRLQGVENSPNLSNNSNQGSPSAAELAFARSRGSSCSLDPAVPCSPVLYSLTQYSSEQYSPVQYSSLVQNLHVVQSPSSSQLALSSPIMKGIERYRPSESDGRVGRVAEPVSSVLEQRDSSSGSNSSNRFSLKALHTENSPSPPSRSHSEPVASASAEPRPTSKLQAALSSFRAVHKTATASASLQSLSVGIPSQSNRPRSLLDFSPIAASSKSESLAEGSFESSASSKSESLAEGSFELCASSKSEPSADGSCGSPEQTELLQSGFRRFDSKVVRLQEWRTQALEATLAATDHWYSTSLCQGLSRLRMHTYSSYSCSAELTRSTELQVAAESWRECVLTRYFWQLRRNVTKASRQRYLQYKGDSYYRSLSLSVGYSALLYQALRRRKRRIAQLAASSTSNCGTGIPDRDEKSVSSCASTNNNSSSSSGSVSCEYSSDFESEGTHTVASPAAAAQISEAADAERTPEPEDEGSVSDIEDEQPQGSLQDLENTLPTTTATTTSDAIRDHIDYNNSRSTNSMSTSTSVADDSHIPVLHRKSDLSDTLEVTLSPEPAPRPPLGVARSLQQTSAVSALGSSSSTPQRRHSTGNQVVLSAVTAAVSSLTLSPQSPNVIPASTDASEHPSAILLEAADSHCLGYVDDCCDSVASGSDLSMFLSSDSDSSSVLEAESLGSLQRSFESESTQEPAAGPTATAASETSPVGPPQPHSPPPLSQSPPPSPPLSPSPPPPLPESPPPSPFPFSSVLREAAAYRRFTQLQQGLYALSQWVLRSQSLASMSDILFEYRCTRKMRVALRMLRAKAML